MSEDEIIKKVRDILNEHGGDDAISIATDRVLLEDYIKSAIPDAVVMLAQKGYRVNVSEFDEGMDNNGVIKMPADFISFGFIKLENWNKVVTKLTEPGTPEYTMAKNEFTSPGVNTPVCLRENVGLYDSIICVPKGGYEYGQYISTYKGSITAYEKEATAVCYMTAALVLGMFGDDQGKQRLSDICMNMLQ